MSKDKITKGKVKYHGVVDIPALIEPVAELRRVVHEVLKKYEGYNMTFDGIEAPDFKDAIQRHLNQMEYPFAIDEETGCPHIWSIMFNAMVLEIKRRTICDRGIEKPYQPIDTPKPVKKVIEPKRVIRVPFEQPLKTDNFDDFKQITTDVINLDNPLFVAMGLGVDLSSIYFDPNTSDKEKSDIVAGVWFGRTYGNPSEMSCDHLVSLVMEHVDVDLQSKVLIGANKKRKIPYTNVMLDDSIDLILSQKQKG